MPSALSKKNLNVPGLDIRNRVTFEESGMNSSRCGMPLDMIVSRVFELPRRSCETCTESKSKLPQWDHV
jgi:hypothetical protein